MNHPLRPVLVAEDEETDGLILHLAFERAGVEHPLLIFRDGQELVHYLNNGGSGESGAPRQCLPKLIILDLKMPHMNGFDVLSWLAGQPTLREIPAVVLSSSSDEADMERARQLGAREYLVKPFGLTPLVTLVQALQGRWLTAPDGTCGPRGSGASGP